MAFYEDEEDSEMNWSNEMTREFLEIYEKYPILWFPGHKDNKNRNAVNNAWLGIQQEFGIDISVRTLRRKKESIMATYRSLRKRVEKEEAEGRSYQPTWYLFTLADRIMKKIRAKDLMYNDEPAENVEAENNHDVRVKRSSAKKRLKLQEPVLEVDGIVEDDSSNQPLEFVNGKSGRASSRKSGTKRKNRENRSESNVIFDTDYTSCDPYDVMEQILPQSSASESYDSCALYCQLLADKLRSLSSRNRMIVQNKIDNLVFRAWMDEIGASSSEQRPFSKSVKGSDAEDNQQNEMPVIDSDPIAKTTVNKHSDALDSDSTAINSVTNMEDQTEDTINEHSDVLGSEFIEDQ
ncbi:uncharacterized protein LOC111044023 [Nilaparvata lugens]|uniref:uncharacterized protein LOC111044023 n=1 Tax=Nilaparvata lugens TaxID=108931 RepID=UPI00193D7265|nr:uncharacterized protein LOC111044023 [Nilaparvata lugens]XP_022184766.2 uncharacterized protein LOC111044023 [Nilaparvata lugens]